MREQDLNAMEAKNNPLLLENFLKQHEFYILKCASKICHRYISKSDDEWSISLTAFHEAIKSYELEKGSFYSFSELVIKRRILDYIKSQGKYNSEVFVDPIVFDTESEEDNDDLALRLAVADQVSKQNTNDLKLEIETVNILFSEYGFSFFDLSTCSPHAAKTRKACAKAVHFMLQNPPLLQELQKSKQLPIKNIEKGSLVPRKILERHRKYIIAAIEILNGDYPYLSEYLSFIRKEHLT